MANPRPSGTTFRSRTRMGPTVRETLEAAANLPHAEPHIWGHCVRCAARAALRWADQFPPFVGGGPQALATAHAEGRQAALEEAADEVVTLPFIVPSELEGDEQFNRNGNYIREDVVIDWLRARAKEDR